MLQAQTKGIAHESGRDGVAREIAAICVAIFGFILLFSLASESETGNMIGRIGSLLYSVLTFVFGKYVAFLAPILVFGWGLALLKGIAIEKLSVKILGIFLAAMCICAMIAIPFADTDLSKLNGFRAGGAIGNFLMHREALSLRSGLGTAGSYLVFSGMLMVSLILITDSLIFPVALRAFQYLAYLHPRHWIGYLAFWQYIRLPRLSLESDMNFTDSESDDEYAAPSRRERMTAADFSGQAFAAADYETVAVDDMDQVQELSVRSFTRPSAEVRSPQVNEAIMEALDSVTAPRRKQPTRPITEPDDLLSLADAQPVQEDLPLFEKYELPELQLLSSTPVVEHRMAREEMTEISENLEKTLAEFGISAQVVQVTQGPTVTRFELQPAPGVKVSRIASLENDIAMCMKAESVRIIAPIPGKAAVGIEIPNRKPTPVFLREILSTEAFASHSSPLAFALGKTISGEPYICDLATMPHLLIAGTTGSGKSVCLNSVIVSILFHMQPDKVKFIMIDPKRVELNVYKDIPHLLAPVVCEPRKAAAALGWALEQMEERYKRLAEIGVRNIDGYNAIVRSHKPHPKAMGRNLEYMSHIVIVVDELADLMIIARNEVEDSIIRLAQMSRAVGMHLIIATQRPSVNVITGIIKANFPCRVAFQVSSKVDSRTILDTNGAEALLGRGDMLFAPAGTSKPIRLQGCYVSDQEVERVADFVRSQQKPHYQKTDFNPAKPGAGPEGAAEGEYELSMNGIDADDSQIAMPTDDGDDDDSMAPWNTSATRPGNSGAAAYRPGSNGRSTSSEDSDVIDEAVLNDAIMLILLHKKASVSLLQRKLKIGFARAGRVMDMMEERGIVGPNVGSKVREILVDPDEYLAKMKSKDGDRF
ncbi:MAG: DNA translocase FtsK [Candidatus Sumerlaeaceae bacterium]|nr:DNA translocase FtsK [Candidatus Sumerlaeaceae bacterium]